MPLSARHHRILTEIEYDLTVTDPRLARALKRGKFPRLRRSSDSWSSRRRRTAAVVVPLLSGLVLLAAGLALHLTALIWIGVPVAQSGPFLVSFICSRFSVHPRPPRPGCRPLS